MSSCREDRGAAGHSEEIGFEDAREKVQRPQCTPCCIHREALACCWITRSAREI